jgi:hypothetical protein
MPSSTYPALPPPSSMIPQPSPSHNHASMEPTQTSPPPPPPAITTKDYTHPTLSEPMQQRTHLMMETKQLISQHTALADAGVLEKNGIVSPCNELPKSEHTLTNPPERVSVRRTKSRSTDDTAQGLSLEAKEALAERMRMENRERKKRWRERNERANKLFGLEPSEHKSRWIAEEFDRRRQKRKEKEARRKLGLTGIDTTAATSQNVSPLTSGQTTPVSSGLTYPPPYHASTMQHAQRHSLVSSAGYPHLTGDLGLTAHSEGAQYAAATAGTTAATSTGAALDRKLPPPNKNHVFFGSACACQGSVHEPGCRHEQSLRMTFNMPPPSQLTQHGHTHHGHAISHAHSASTQHATLPSLQQTAQHLPMSHASSPIANQLSVSSAGSLPPHSMPPTPVLALSPVAPQSQLHVQQPHAVAGQTGHQRSEEDFPMDAVITLMQLNHGWRGLGGTGEAPTHAIPSAEQSPMVGAAAAAAAAAAAVAAAAAASGNPSNASWHTPTVRSEPMTPSLSHGSTLSSVSSIGSAASADAAAKMGLLAPTM